MQGRIGSNTLPVLRTLAKGVVIQELRIFAVFHVRVSPPNGESPTQRTIALSYYAVGMSVCSRMVLDCGIVANQDAAVVLAAQFLRV